jgi:hypothetical protein
VECWDIPDPFYSGVDIIQVRDTIHGRVADLAGRLGL